MKKISIFLLVVVLVVAALPIIGNKIIESSLDDRLTTLSTYGLEVSRAETDSAYLSTKKHYEFLLRDADKFVAYLNQYSDRQLPPYINVMFEGVVIGVDIEYCNFPLSRDISVDIYPLTLSQSTMQGIKADDVNFHEYLEKFLYSKGILYHIDYNIISEEFDGYIKDINESHTLKDGTKLRLKLLNATFRGHGKLIAPDEIISNVETLNLEVDSASTKLTFTLDGFSSSSSFESKSTYTSSVDLKNFRLIVSATNENLVFEIDDIKANFSSNTQGDKAELNAKSSLSSMSVKSDKIDAVLKNLAYDIAIKGLDKDSLEELRVILSQSKVSSAIALQKDLQESMIKLFSKGIELEIAKFSLENITLNKTENLDGFEIKSLLKIKEDKDLAAKVGISPLLVAQNIDMSVNIKISKLIYAKLTNNVPMTSMASAYVKEDGESVLFDLTFINGEFRVNGQALR